MFVNRRFSGKPVATGAVLVLLTVLLLPSILGIAAGSGAPSSVPVAPAVSPVGAPTEAPIFGGSYVVDGGKIYVQLGFAGFANIWEGVDYNGSDVFAYNLWIAAFPLVGGTLPLVVGTYEKGVGYTNETIPVPQGGTLVPIAVAVIVTWTAINVTMGGVTWHGFISVPASLLPLSSLDLGGLDLLVMAVISEVIIGFSILTVAAKLLVSRALYAPKFRMIIWGHVFLFSVIGIVIADYEWIVQTFAGWSPLFYVGPILLLWFLFCLSLFNKAGYREVFQIVSRPNQELAFRRYRLRVGKDTDGNLVAIRNNWGDFWARVWGHFVVIKWTRPLGPTAFDAPVADQASPTDAVKRRKLKRRSAGMFKVTNPQDDETEGVMFARPGSVMVIHWPHLTVHRMRHYDAKTVQKRDGSMVQVPARDLPRWSLPHYVPGSAEEIQFENIHFKDAIAASANLIHDSDISRVLGETETAFYILQAEFDTKLDAAVESKMRSAMQVLGRTSRDISDDEARAEATQIGRHPPAMTRAQQLSKDLSENPASVAAAPK